ncbi:MAG: beta-eliminating lyase-related protein [Pseudomonadota bacterium]
MDAPQRFFSDNAAMVHPAVMTAIAAANPVDTAYDGDALSAQLDSAFSDLFETRVTALWVPTGTAANSIALAAFVRPWQSVLCHAEAHIEVDECGAPAMFTGGAKLELLGGEGARITAEAIDARMAAIRKDVHQVQPAAISITNASEYGLAWRPQEVAAIGDAARRHGLHLHMDGARFAGGVAHVGCAPADVTWRAGVDALSFGCVKNGGMNAEGLLFFGDAPAGVHELRKRSGHLQSKGRFMAAQLLAMIQDGLWLDNARAANAAAAMIAQAAGTRLLYPVEANEIFLRVTPDEAAKLRAAGFDFYDWGEGAARLVTSWNHSVADVQPLADAIAGL